MDIELLFNIANISFLAGTILLTNKVVKNRNTLKDIDPYGSSLNVIGMFAASMALIELKLYSTFLISIPTLFFWMIASVYSFKNTFSKTKDINKGKQNR